MRIGFCREPLPGHERYVGRLVLPYPTKHGIVQIKFRAMDDSEPKYYGIDGVKPKLYGVDALFEDSAVIGITEGEFDRNVAQFHCGLPSVGVAGANAWLPHFARCFTGYDRVVILADGDEAGLKFARRVADDLDNAHIVAMPDGMDVTDVYVRGGGADALKERIGL